VEESYEVVETSYEVVDTSYQESVAVEASYEVEETVEVETSYEVDTVSYEQNGEVEAVVSYQETAEVFYEEDVQGETSYKESCEVEASYEETVTTSYEAEYNTTEVSYQETYDVDVSYQETENVEVSYAETTDVSYQEEVNISYEENTTVTEHVTYEENVTVDQEEEGHGFALSYTYNEHPGGEDTRNYDHGDRYQIQNSAQVKQDHSSSSKKGSSKSSSKSSSSSGSDSEHDHHKKPASHQHRGVSPPRYIPGRRGAPQVQTPQPGYGDDRINNWLQDSSHDAAAAYEVHPGGPPRPAPAYDHDPRYDDNNQGYRGDANNQAYPQHRPRGDASNRGYPSDQGYAQPGGGGAIVAYDGNNQASQAVPGVYAQPGSANAGKKVMKSVNNAFKGFMKGVTTVGNNISPVMAPLGAAIMGEAARQTAHALTHPNGAGGGDQNGGEASLLQLWTR
jgi:hypothetical protein